MDTLQLRMLEGLPKLQQVATALCAMGEPYSLVHLPRVPTLGLDQMALPLTYKIRAFQMSPPPMQEPIPLQ